MSYNAPNYEQLHQITKKLILSFNVDARRYKVGSYTDLIGAALMLETKYKENLKSKPTGVFSYFTNREPDSNRLDQIACITQLATTLSAHKDSKPETNDRYFSILLGSCVFRYLRLKKSYETITAYATKEENSALISALFKMLRLSSDNELDALTVFDCCSAYQTYLLQGQIADSYGYIKKNKSDFFAKLNRIINKYEASGESILKRVEYLRVIQSVDNILVKQDESARAHFSRLIKELRGFLANKKELVIDDLKEDELWKKFSAGMKEQDKALLEKILFVSNTVINQDELVSEGSGVCEFEKTLIARLALYKQYVLVGAYAVTLRKLNEVGHKEELTVLDERMNNALGTTLTTALGITVTNKLDTEHEIFGFRYLQLFLDLPNMTKQVDAKAWGGDDILTSYVQISLSELQKQPETKQALTI